MQKVYDYIIFGGGIVGISTVWQLQQRNLGNSILALHQMVHNSGVIHAGVCYVLGRVR